jgi:hypothetical protein
MRTNETTEKLFTQLEGVLCPWLGVVYQWMPSNPQDLFAVTDKIHGRGFRRLAWQKNYADPDWILPKWRTKSGVICPRCQIEIQALKYSELWLIANQKLSSTPANRRHCISRVFRLSEALFTPAIIPSPGWKIISPSNARASTTWLPVAWLLSASGSNTSSTAYADTGLKGS